MHVQEFTLSGVMFMLRVSLEILPLVVRIPFFWITVGSILVAAVVGFWRRASAPTRRAFELVFLFVAPVAVLLWGLAFWGACPGCGDTWSKWAWPFLGPSVGFYGQIVLAIILVWRHRRRIFVAAPLALVSTFWMHGASFVTSMAVTNCWL
jgi:hypothetical protein